MQPHKNNINDNKNAKKCLNTSVFPDCRAIFESGHTETAVYTIKTGGTKLDVLCDMETWGDAWTVSNMYD